MDDDADSCGSQGTSTSTPSCAAIVLRLIVGLLAIVTVSNWYSNGDGHQFISLTVHRAEYAPSSLQQRHLLSTVEFPPRRPGGPASSNCSNACGNVSIPYPFGLSQECARTPDFQLDCRYISGVTEGLGIEIPSGFWPFLTSASGSFVNSTINEQGSVGTVQSVNSFRVLSINGTSGTLILDTTEIKAIACNEDYSSQTTDISSLGNASIVLNPDGPYRISGENVFFIIGCSAGGQYSGGPILDSQSSSNPTCGPTSCVNQHTYVFCSAFDCCLMSLEPMGEISFVGGGYCGYSSILYPPTFSMGPLDTAPMGTGTYGIQILWVLEVSSRTQFPNCSSIEQSTEDYACSKNSNCSYRSVTSPWAGYAPVSGYFCFCETGYFGDGYVNGTSCTDINECDNNDWNECAPSANCTNLPGSYTCSCPSFMRGDGYNNTSGRSAGCTYINFCDGGEQNDCDSNAKCASSSPLNADYNCTCESNLVGNGYHVGKAGGTGCRFPNKSQLALIAGLTSAGLAFVILNGLVIWYLYRKRQKALLNEPFGSSDFSRREFLLEIQSKEGANICKLFTFEELSKATNNFSIDGVLGTGGFGTVYEGTLDDGTKVAIKRAKHDVGGAHDDTKQFINEVTILSQVNHRNLVKLLGCCLETPVPVLIYEFISNGNLQEHLQRPKRLLDQNSEEMDPRYQPLTWNKRLRIAIATAEALTYLHFGTSPPIYHRDVKTANILLDDKYVAKVADFGLSKFVPLEATHLSTAIQGTPGYLDPEYFQNYQITDKSDVYSFGVVLLELVTAQKPLDLSQQAPDQNLALRCNRLMKHGRLEDIIDPVLDASSNPKMLEVVHSVAKVAMKCVERLREARPTMREVLEQLQLIAKSTRKFDVPADVLFEDDSGSLVSGLSTATNSQDFYVSSNPPSKSSNSSTDAGRRLGRSNPLQNYVGHEDDSASLVNGMSTNSEHFHFSSNPSSNR